ncbi:MAG: ABC transporter substrate-binding protein [Candidatus Pacebacteria bacterium]|nr:ABC transporter substrate-binding protein [Candidatus Paceibacterota bacterium]
MNPTKKGIYTIGIVVILGLVCTSFWSKSPSVTSVSDSTTSKGPIKIGVVEPLTGGAAPYGEAGKNGFAIAVDEINKIGGINGRQIEAVYEDSKCSGKDALNAAQKLINTDGVQYIVGAMCSSEVLAILPLTEQKPVIFLGQGTSPDITGKGKYFFRTFPSDALSGRALAEYLVPKYKKVATITEKTDYAVALEKTFIQSVRDLGGEVIALETFNGDMKDFKTILTKIKLTNPEVLFINPQVGSAGALIAKQARDMGIKAQFVEFFMTGDEFVKANSAVNGAVILDVPSLNSNRPQSARFVTNYKAQFGGTINYPFVAGEMYDYAYLLKQTIEKTGTGVEANKKYLNGLDSYSGVIGDFSFDNTGDVKGVGFSFKKVENNTLVDLR